jgi:hypothetical protein
MKSLEMSFPQTHLLVTPYQWQKNAKAKKDSLPFGSVPHTPPIHPTLRTRKTSIERRCLDQRSSRPNLNLESLVLLLLLDLQQQSAVDMREDTTKSDRGADECVEFFVSTDGELQVTGCDTLDFEILRGVLESRLA